MKYFVFSDVHGDYEAMREGLAKAGYDKKNKEHQIISIGDNFGRATTGGGSWSIYNYLVLDKHANQPICIKGNHELILEDIFRKGYLNQLDNYNGEDKTIVNLYGCMDLSHVTTEAIKNKVDQVVELWEDRNDIWCPTRKKQIASITLCDEGKQFEAWLRRDMPMYFETKHYLFFHGWPLLNYTPLMNPYYMTKEMDIDEFKDYSAWADTKQHYKVHCKYFPYGYEKWLVVGHYYAAAFNPATKDKDVRALRYDDFYPYKDEMHKVIFCDQCTALSHHIEVVVIEDEPLEAEKELVAE